MTTLQEQDQIAAMEHARANSMHSPVSFLAGLEFERKRQSESVEKAIRMLRHHLSVAERGNNGSVISALTELETSTI